MKLVKFDDNWSDEMDLEGFMVMSEKEWEEKVNAAHKMTEEFEVYFGTNESNEYVDGKDFLNSFTVVDITDAEVEVINKFFSGQFGHFPDISDYYVEEQEEDEG